MSRSVLLQLARDSIEEVFQSQKNIDKETLLQMHPLLAEKISTTLNIFINKELKGSYTTQDSEASLLTNIIIAAKKAAFEGSAKNALTTSEYLHCEIELLLDTPEGRISQTDPAILKDTLI